MKLYKLSQNVNNEYDTYDGFVVCADNAYQAKRIIELDKKEHVYGCWVKDYKDIKCKYLGEAVDGLKVGEILSSFNAG